MNAHQALNVGLLQNYAGSIAPQNLSILGLEAKTVESNLTEDWVYTDQWFGSLQGGGRELVFNQKTQESSIRLYAGGTVSKAVASAGLEKKDVISFLVRSIQALPTTRLTTPEDFQDGPWHYSYRPSIENQPLGLLAGIETIAHNQVILFQHNFLISPIR